MRFKIWSVDRWTVAIFGLFAAVLIAKCSVLHYPHFIFTYPWISYDGYQWISDSLFYLDRNINITQRNPALPMTFALLRSFDAIDIYPWLLGALTFAFYVALYWLARAFVKPNAARLMILWFFFVFKIHAFFDFVLADPWAITASTFGIASLVRVKENPRYLIAAAALFGISLNYQFAVGFMSPALIWFVLGGLGLTWCREHIKEIAIGGAVFLALALPQFIAKWILFGTPLYSHVIHFPLIRFHLFGLPGYFMNFFAFLGWPLAFVVIAGLKRAIKERSIEWQLVHLSGTCMFVFWILCYLWLDIRFLLYLVPMWAVYAAYAIEIFSFQTMLSFVGKTPFQKILIICAVYVGLTMSAIKIPAFDGGYLGLTPQTGIRFDSTPISQWQVPAMVFHNFKTEYVDSDSSMLTLIKYQRYYRKSDYDQNQKILGDEAVQVGKLIRANTTSGQTVGVLGDMLNVFELKMSMFNTIERNLIECSANTTYCVVKLQDAKKLSAEWKVVWQGEKILLAERRS